MGCTQCSQLFAAKPNAIHPAAATTSLVCGEGQNTEPGEGSTVSEPISVLILGIDGVGKTSIVNCLRGESDASVQPTCGLNLKTIALRVAPPAGADTDNDHSASLSSPDACAQQLAPPAYCVRLLDLGGGASIRGYWSNYFAEVHAIVYVFDSGTDVTRRQDALEALQSCITHESISGKPVLILENKLTSLPTSSAIPSPPPLSLRDILIGDAWSGNSDEETSSGNSGEETSSGNSGKEISSGNSDKVISSGNSDKETSSGNSGKEISSGNCGKETSSVKSDKETSQVGSRRTEPVAKTTVGAVSDGRESSMPHALSTPADESQQGEEAASSRGATLALRARMRALSVSGNVKIISCSCSAEGGVDHIADAFRWLARKVTEAPGLRMRVLNDVAVQEEKHKALRAAQLARVRALQRQRTEESPP